MRGRRPIIIRERFLESAAKDVTTFLSLAAVCVVARLMDSQAVGWVGSIMMLMFIAARVLRTINDNTKTIEEARKILDEMEAYDKRSILDRN